jgi:putative ABC transport system ATP-binding protein
MFDSIGFNNLLNIYNVVASLDISHDKKYYYERIVYLAIYKVLLNQITLINARDYHPFILFIPMEIMIALNNKMLEQYEGCNTTIIRDINLEHQAIMLKFDEYNKQHLTTIENQKDILLTNYQLQLQLHIAKTRVMASVVELITIFLNICTVITINPFQLLCLLIFIDSVLSDMMYNVDITDQQNKSAGEIEDQCDALVEEFIANKNIIYGCVKEQEYLEYMKQRINSFYDIRKDVSSSYKLNKLHTNFECYYQRKVMLLTWIIPKQLFLTWIYTGLKEICYVLSTSLVAYKDAQNKISKLHLDLIKDINIPKIINPTIDIGLLNEGVFLNIKPFLFNFEQKHVFTIDTELVLPSQKWITLQGSSGSGKTTICNLFMKMIKCDEDEIYFMGRYNIYDYDLIRRYVSFVKPDADLFNNTIRFNIHFGVDTTDQTAIYELTQEYMCLFGLKHIIPLMDNNIHTLSTGEKQRLKIIRCILQDKPIWLLDEITSNIDADCEDDVMKTLKSIQISKKKTVIHITHNSDLFKYSDHQLRIHANKFTLTDTIIPE